MTLTINPDTLTTWHLANMAGVASPDRPDGIGFAEPPADPDPSPGATFLRNIARESSTSFRMIGVTLREGCSVAISRAARS